MKKLAEANHFDELTFYINRGDFSVIQSFVTLAFEKSFWLDFYCFSHSMSSWVDSASSFSFVSMSMSAETLKVTEGGLVELSASISAAPMDSKLSVSYTHLRAHETLRYLVCRLLLEKKK